MLEAVGSRTPKIVRQVLDARVKLHDGMIDYEYLRKRALAQGTAEIAEMLEI
jgi:hypothetical protein